MKKILLTLAAFAFMASSAMAAPTDMAKIKCNEFTASQENALYLTFWLDGYMSGESDNTDVSAQYMEKFAGYLNEACTKAPGKTLMEVKDDMPETPVEGDTKDLLTMSCKELLSSDKTEMAYSITWIDGYMSAKSNNTMMDNEWMQKLGTHLGEYCSKNQAKTIGDAINAMK